MNSVHSWKPAKRGAFLFVFGAFGTSWNKHWKHLKLHWELCWRMLTHRSYAALPTCLVSLVFQLLSLHCLAGCCFHLTGSAQLHPRLLLHQPCRRAPLREDVRWGSYPKQYLESTCRYLIGNIWTSNIFELGKPLKKHVRHLQSSLTVHMRGPCFSLPSEAFVNRVSPKALPRILQEFERFKTLPPLQTQADGWGIWPRQKRPSGRHAAAKRLPSGVKGFKSDGLRIVGLGRWLKPMN